MLVHLYIGWALVHGWMTRLILLHKWALGHLMQKITKKACFLGFPSRKFIFQDRNSKLATNVFKRMRLILEHVALAWLQGIPCCEWFLGKNHQKWVIFVISHNLNIILWTIPNSQLNSFGLENYPRRCRYRKKVMFEYFHDMLRFGAFYRKNGIKTIDFRDLLMEGAIFIAGTKFNYDEYWVGEHIFQIKPYNPILCDSIHIFCKIVIALKHSNSISIFINYQNGLLSQISLVWLITFRYSRSSVFIVLIHKWMIIPFPILIFFYDLMMKLFIH